MPQRALGGTEPDLPPGSTRRSRNSRSGEDVAKGTEEIHDRIVPCRYSAPEDSQGDQQQYHEEDSPAQGRPHSPVKVSRRP